MKTDAFLSHFACTKARSARAVAAAAAITLAAAAFAQGPAPKAIVSSSPFSASSLVPGGQPDERFAADLGEIYRSPSGNRWILAFRTTQSRVGILTGQGSTAEVAFIADGNTQLPWTDDINPDFYRVEVPGAGGITSLEVDNGTYAINDAGDIAISLRETFSNNRVIAKRVAGVWSVAVRETTDIPFEATGEVFGGVLVPFGISPDGADVYYRASATVGTLPDAQDDFIVLGPTVIQYNVSTVAGSGGRTFDNLGNALDVRSGADTTSWMVSVDMSGATTDDEAVLVDGAIVVREGGTLGGLGVRGAGRLGAVAISGDGTQYIHRGQQTSGTVDWVNRSGAIVAQRLAPIVPASATTWAAFPNFARTFLSLDVNNAGQFSILGGTSTAGQNIARLVYNNERVLLSDRDAIDLDGNGLADDSAFADFNGGSGGELNVQVLGSDAVYAVVRIVDSATPAAGTFLGEALVRLPLVDEPACPACPADFDQDGGVTGADVEAFFLAFESGDPCGDTDLDGGVTGADVEAFFIAFEAGGC
jgi:hypothetical protein